MHREHGGPINVLVEGCGMSTVGEELAERAEKQGLSVKIFKTDVYSNRKFQQLVTQARERGSSVDTAGYHQLTPEELYKLGRNKFHLVISRSGGLTYTRLPKEVGLRSVWHVLRPGGEAHILTETLGFRVEPEEGKKRQFAFGSAIKLIESREVTPEGKFLGSTRGLYYMEEGDPSSHILRIKKGKEFESFFPRVEPDYWPTLKPITGREEAEAHKTVFHEMEKPPIDLTPGQFEDLKAHAKTMESHSLGGQGQVGRGGEVTQRQLWPGLALVLRHGRYYLARLDEFGFIDRILWKEKQKQ